MLANIATSPTPATTPALATVAGLSDDDLAAHITTLCGQIYAAEFNLLEHIREIDRRRESHPDLFGSKSTADWLNWRCGIGPSAAREKVRVARALPALPEISAALREGRVSYSKVRAMTRIATADNESYLMMIAEHGTASQMERLVQAYRASERAADPTTAEMQNDRRACDWYVDEDGMVVISARLPPEEGARLVRALEAGVKRQLAAEADATSAPATCQITTPQRRADALCALVDDATSGDLPAQQIVVHVAAETPHVNRLEPINSYIGAVQTRRLACDAMRETIVEALDGTRPRVLALGRQTRVVSTALRRALTLRDHGCRFPGCRTTRHVDAHHIHHWLDGGETNLDNLVLLCRRHHRLLHEGGWHLARGATGRLTFRSPDGDTVPTAHRLPADSDPGTLARLCRDLGVHVSAETCRSRWDGSRLELDYALPPLLN